MKKAGGILKNNKTKYHYPGITIASILVNDFGSLTGNSPPPTNTHWISHVMTAELKGRGTFKAPLFPFVCIPFFPWGVRHWHGLVSSTCEHANRWAEPSAPAVAIVGHSLYMDFFPIDSLDTLLLRLNWPYLWCFWGFPGGSVVKNQPANAGDPRDLYSISRLGRPWGVGNANLL